MNKGHSLMCASQCINGEDKCTCRPETKCCSGIATLQTEKQSTENSAPLVEVESVETDRSLLATEMARFSGFATAILANLQEAQDDLLLAQLVAPVFPQVERSLAVGLQEILTLCLSRLGRCSQLVTALTLLSQQKAASAGQQQTVTSQCQCAAMKGKSLG